MKLRKCFEVLMVRFAAWILQGRNLSRSSVVSRRDNNEMWYMAEKLEGISKRMMDEYDNVYP